MTSKWKIEKYAPNLQTYCLNSASSYLNACLSLPAEPLFIAIHFAHLLYKFPEQIFFVLVPDDAVERQKQKHFIAI